MTNLGYLNTTIARRITWVCLVMSSLFPSIYAQHDPTLNGILDKLWTDTTIDKSRFSQQLDSLASIYPKGTLDSILTSVSSRSRLSSHSAIQNHMLIHKWQRDNQIEDYQYFHLAQATQIAINNLHEKGPELIFRLAYHQSRHGQYTNGIKNYKYYIEHFGNDGPADKNITAHIRVASLFSMLENNSAAEFYLQEGIRPHKEQPNRKKTVHTFRIAGIAAKTIDTNLAKKYLRQAIQHMDENTGFPQRISSYSHLADLLLPDSLSRAREYLKFSTSTIGQPNTPAKFRYYLVKARYFFLSNQQDSLSHVLAQLSKFPSFKTNLDYVQLNRQIAEVQGDFVSAYNLHIEEQDLKDSIYNLKNNQIIFDLEEKYKSAQKEATILQLNKEKEIADFQLSQKNRFLGFAIISAIILSLLLLYLYKLYKDKMLLLSKVSSQNEKISQALDQERLLKREIHHRVKNNLQVISSLFSLQANYSNDPNSLAALMDAKNRVKSMSLIHQFLHEKKKRKSFPIETYIQDLCGQLFSSYNIRNDEVSLKTQIDSVDFDLDTMTYIGLVLNELVSNCLEHGISDSNSPELTISVESHDSFNLIMVRDNGPGFKQSITDVLSSPSFGIQLIQAMVARFGGILCIGNYHGAYIQFSIPHSEVNDTL